LSRVIKAHEVVVEEILDGDGHEPNGHRPARSEVNGRADHAAEELTRLLTEAKRQAAAIVERAERLASQRLAELASKEAAVEEAYEKARAAGREVGYEEGYAQGYRDGLEKGEREVEERVGSLLIAAQGVLEEARRAQWQLEERAREDVLKLAIAIAEKLVCRSLSSDRSLALSILEQMLARVEGSDTARVRLPREVLALLEERGGPVLDRVSAANCQFLFVADDGLKVGDVVIETDWGLIDGRIQSRWQRIMQGLDLMEDAADGSS